MHQVGEGIARDRVDRHPVEQNAERVVQGAEAEARNGSDGRVLHGHGRDVLQAPQEGMGGQSQVLHALHSDHPQRQPGQGA